MNVQKSFNEGETTGSGSLYLVATPIGNLEDMTFRAIRILREVDLIAAEDTRQTRKLLTHYEISTRTVSYHEHNKRASGPELIRMLSEGQSIALVSDAGLPAISDPGADLAMEAIANGIAVIPVPGANAALSALIMSGLPTERFLFAGFPPRERKPLLKWLEPMKAQTATLLFYESPHRLIKTLEGLLEAFGDRPASCVRELTKKHEEAVRGLLSECAAHFAQYPPLGEFCVVVKGLDEAEAEQQAIAEAWWAELDLAAHVEKYEQQYDRKEAIKRTALDRGMPKRDVYNAVNRA